jgi:hypothetical protein
VCFLAISAKRKLTKEKKRRKRKNHIFPPPFFFVFRSRQTGITQSLPQLLSMCYMIWLLYLIILYFFFRLDPNSVSFSQVPFVSLFSGSASSDPRGLFWERNHDDHDFTCLFSLFFLRLDFIILITLDLAFRLTVSFLIDSLTSVPLVLYFFNYTFSSTMALIPLIFFHSSVHYSYQEKREKKKTKGRTTIFFTLVSHFAH